MLSFTKKIESKNSTKKNAVNINKVVIILFTIMKMRKAERGGSPVVTKVYILKFTSTFKSVMLFSNKIARHILPKGLKERHKINKSKIYMIKYFSKYCPALSCPYN